MKNKTLISISICLFISISSFAQIKTVRYCKMYVVSISGGLLRKIHEDIGIDYGRTSRYFNFKDTSIVNGLNKITEFDNSIDALNYMIDSGWELTAIIPHNRLAGGEKDRKEFYFKKEFKVEDFNN